MTKTPSLTKTTHVPVSPPAHTSPRTRAGGQAGVLAVLNRWKSGLSNFIRHEIHRLEEEVELFLSYPMEMIDFDQYLARKSVEYLAKYSEVVDPIS